jgi:hypothetical protein
MAMELYHLCLRNKARGKWHKCRRASRTKSFCGDGRVRGCWRLLEAENAAMIEVCARLYVCVSWCVYACTCVFLCVRV